MKFIKALTFLLSCSIFASASPVYQILLSRKTRVVKPGTSEVVAIKAVWCIRYTDDLGDTIEIHEQPMQMQWTGPIPESRDVCVPGQSEGFLNHPEARRALEVGLAAAERIGAVSMVLQDSVYRAGGPEGFLMSGGVTALGACLSYWSRAIMASCGGPGVEGCNGLTGRYHWVDAGTFCGATAFFTRCLAVKDEYRLLRQCIDGFKAWCQRRLAAMSDPAEQPPKDRGDGAQAPARTAGCEASES